MNKWVISLVLAIVIVVAAGAYYWGQALVSEGDEGFDSSVQTFTLTSITYDNFAAEMSSNDMVRAIPEDSEILLKFYNFSTGQRQIEKAFVLRRGGVVETDPVAFSDVILMIDSKYLAGLTNQNLCQVIQNANANGDLGLESGLSKAELAWKFKSMMEYKGCFGL